MWKSSAVLIKRLLLSDKTDKPDFKEFKSKQSACLAKFIQNVLFVCFFLLFSSAINMYARHSFDKKKSVTSLNRQVKKKKTLKNGQKSTLIIRYKLLFQSNYQAKRHFPPSHWPAITPDGCFHNCIWQRAEALKRKPILCHLPLCYNHTAGSDVLPLRFLSPTSSLFNHILPSVLPRWRLRWLLKWCGWFFGIKSTLLKRRPALSHWTNLHRTQLSHLWRSVLWQGSLSFTAPRSPNRTPSGCAKCCHWYGLFPTARLFWQGDCRSRVAAWRPLVPSLSMFTMHGYCWNLTRTFNWDGRLCPMTPTPDRDDLLTRRHPPPQQQVVIFPLSQPVIVGYYSRPVSIPLIELQIIQSGRIGPNFEEFQVSWFLLELKSELV